MKRIIILLLCAAVLLCGCAGEHTKDNKDNKNGKGKPGTSENGNPLFSDDDDDIIPEKEIRADVVTFFELDKSDEKSVARLFADLDKAYQKAMHSDKLYQDLLDYAKEVKQILDAFDATFDWEMWDRKSGPDTTASYEEVMAGYNIRHQYIAVTITYGDSLDGVEDVENIEAGYSFAAGALALVDVYNDFFYGGNHYTEDDHNALLSNYQ